MDDLNAKDLDGLNLSLEESRDIIECLAKKEILRTINTNQTMNYCKL